MQNDGSVRIVINNELVMLGDTIVPDGIQDITMGQNIRGMIDQYRIFSDGITPEQEVFLYYDSTSGEWFKQTSNSGAYMKSILEQKANSGTYTKEIFAQSSFLVGRNKHIFYQKSEINDWQKYSVFSQVSFVENDATGRVIRRIN